MNDLFKKKKGRRGGRYSSRRGSGRSRSNAKSRVAIEVPEIDENIDTDGSNLTKNERAAMLSEIQSGNLTNINKSDTLFTRITKTYFKKIPVLIKLDLD